MTIGSLRGLRLENFQHVACGANPHGDVRVPRDAADVRRKHDVRMALERVGSSDGFGGEAVETGGGHLTRADRIDQRFLVDQPAARGIHQ